MKLSIIIPVFNMERYIEKCLKSVTSQSSITLSEFEIIVVNDGSTDSSQYIIDGFNWKEVNHLILQKKNGGLSSARNYGFSYAKGEYVWFVDSDDWVDEDCLKRIFPMLSGADVVHFPMYYRETSTRSYIEKCISRGETGADIIRGDYQYPVQFTIYKTNFLRDNHLSFQEGIVMEDLHFTPRALYKANKVVVSDFPVYHYLQREGSIMMEMVKAKRLKDRIWIAHDLYRYMQESVAESDKYKWAECIITDVNAIMFDAFRSHDQKIKDMVHPFINKERHLTIWLKYAKNRRNRIWYYLSKLCLGNFYFTYSILFKLRYRN